MRRLVVAAVVASAFAPIDAPAQQGPSLNYTPEAETTVTFPFSAGTPVEARIMIAPVNGAAGGRTLLSCLVQSPLQSFRVLTPVLGFDTGGAVQMMVLSCTPSFVNLQMGTLVCAETISEGPSATRRWPLVCPLVTPAPAFSSTPADGQTVALDAPPGTTGTLGPVFGNPGLLNYSVTGCTVTGSGFSVATVFPITVGPGASVPINASCVVPATAGVTIMGNLQCSTSIGGVAPSYPLQCRAVDPPPDLIMRSSFELDEGSR